MAPPGEVWNIRNKAYNCLAYMMINNLIPFEVSRIASKVRDTGHSSFLPWKPARYTANWRTNFRNMREKAADGTVVWDEQMLSDQDKADMRRNLAEIVRQFGGNAPGLGEQEPADANEGGGTDGDEEAPADEDAVEEVRQRFGGKSYFVATVVVSKHAV